jgi:hypothetical protein
LKLTRVGRSLTRPEGEPIDLDIPPEKLKDPTFVARLSFRPSAKDLANGRILIGRSKTQAGLREITMLPILRDILAAHKASSGTIDPDDLVFPTATGRRRTSDTLRGLLHTVFERADELLGARGHVPLPAGLSAHKLRHTFASVLVATGEDPISVMGQLGHTHPGFTLRVYSHPMSNPGERTRLKALVAGERTKQVSEVRTDHLDGPALEEAVRGCMRCLGGRAGRADVLAALREELRGRLGPLDLEVLPSGVPRWEAHVAKARQRLVRQGVIRGDSPRGVWELSDLTRSTTYRRSRPPAAAGIEEVDPPLSLESPPKLRPERGGCQ